MAKRPRRRAWRASVRPAALVPAGPDGARAERKAHAAPAGHTAPAEVPTGEPCSGGSPRPAADVAADRRLPSAPDAQVPRLLRVAAAWSWRALLVGLVIYLAFRAAAALRLVVLPLIAALLLAALLRPLTGRLRRVGMPSLTATWCTALIAVLLVAGLTTLVASQLTANYPTMAAEVQHTAADVQKFLAGPPLHISGARLQQYVSDLGHYLASHKALVAGTVLTGGRFFAEFAAGLVLMLFITFFLLKDGDRIWGWLISGLPTGARGRADRAGMAAWQALESYVRGSLIVGAIHAMLIGLALWLLGVPLVLPLIIVVFAAGFVPLIGILVAGALAILVTLATQGWLAAVILLAVFLVENQIEGHLLQPLVMGRVLRLHPLAIILVLAVGGIVAGIPGAIVAVPATAVVVYAWPYLRDTHNSPPETHSPV